MRYHSCRVFREQSRSPGSSARCCTYMPKPPLEDGTRHTGLGNAGNPLKMQRKVETMSRNSSRLLGMSLSKYGGRWRIPDAPVTQWKMSYGQVSRLTREDESGYEV